MSEWDSASMERCVVCIGRGSGSGTGSTSRTGRSRFRRHMRRQHVLDLQGSMFGTTSRLNLGQMRAMRASGWSIIATSFDGRVMDRRETCCFASAGPIATLVGPDRFRAFGFALLGNAHWLCPSAGIITLMQPPRSAWLARRRWFGEFAARGGTGPNPSGPSLAQCAAQPPSPLCSHAVGSAGQLCGSRQSWWEGEPYRALSLP